VTEHLEALDNLVHSLADCPGGTSAINVDIKGLEGAADIKDIIAKAHSAAAAANSNNHNNNNNANNNAAPLVNSANNNVEEGDDGLNNNIPGLEHNLDQVLNEDNVANEMMENEKADNLVNNHFGNNNNAADDEDDNLDQELDQLLGGEQNHPNDDNALDQVPDENNVANEMLENEKADDARENEEVSLLDMSKKAKSLVQTAADLKDRVKRDLKTSGSLQRWGSPVAEKNSRGSPLFNDGFLRPM